MLTAKKKKLKIAQVAPLWFPIPPEKYGGIERIVALLTDELVKRGHEVTLFAAAGSKTKGILKNVFPEPLIEAGVSWNNPFWNLRNLSYVYELAKKGKFDIIHSHLDVWTLFFQDLGDIPTILTMHNPLYRTTDATKDDRLRLFTQKSKNTNIVFISKSAQRTAMVKFAKPKVIYNGIDMENFEFNSRGGEHFVWIARVNKHKGIENAIAAAEKLNAKLVLAGRLDPTQKEYFRSKIKPHLSRKIRFIGELSDKELSDFYGGAKALLYPIEWEEPFGLVVAEAMACGTPVIAYRRGSMPELINHGKTGYLADDLKGLIDAMKKVGTLDRDLIRKYAEERFSKERMADDYENLYYQLLK